MRWHPRLLRASVMAVSAACLVGVIGCSEQAARENRNEAKVAEESSSVITGPGSSAPVAAPGAMPPPAAGPVSANSLPAKTEAAPTSEVAGQPPTRVEPPAGEAYDRVTDNAFQRVSENPRSTFGIDVDTASYANVRRFLTHGMMPPKDAVRIEELVNYFTYNDPPPKGKDPFSITIELDRCPWKPEHRLARIGIKGKTVSEAERPPSNLVFLIDVSGSMSAPNKLPLLKNALGMMVDRLGEKDRIGIVVYASESGVKLPSTPCNRKEPIVAALNGLHAGGSTNGGAGIQLAYEMAVGNFIDGGINRVILCTDGDFNVGISNQQDLVRMIEQKAKTGVFLSVLGFGMGNLQDATLEAVADKGNGHYAYIDNVDEARKVLVDQLGGTLVTIAKDVKIQIEFNPARVGAYRLIGYENRLLAAKDFNDDTKDAGEVGAGHTVTALYELVPPGKEGEATGTDPLRYQKTGDLSDTAKFSNELLTVKLRFKEPEGQESQLLEGSVSDVGVNPGTATDDFQFSAAVAAFGMLLRNSPYKGNATFGSVLEMAESSVGSDPEGYRHQFIDLVRRAERLAPQQAR